MRYTKATIRCPTMRMIGTRIAVTTALTPIAKLDQELFRYYNFLGIAHYVNGDYDEAVRWGRMSAIENPNFTSNLKLLSAALAGRGDVDEARRVAATLCETEPGFDIDDYDRCRNPFREPVKSRLMSDLRTALATD